VDLGVEVDEEEDGPDGRWVLACALDVDGCADASAVCRSWSSLTDWVISPAFSRPLPLVVGSLPCARKAIASGSSAGTETVSLSGL